MGTKITGIGADGFATTSGDTGTLEVDGSLTIGNADTDNIVFNAEVNSNIIPNTTNSFSLGSSDGTKVWSGVYATEGYLGSLIVQSSTESELIRLQKGDGETKYLVFESEDPGSPGTYIDKFEMYLNAGENFIFTTTDTTDDVLFRLNGHTAIYMDGYPKEVRIWDSYDGAYNTQINSSLDINGKAITEDVVPKTAGTYDLGSAEFMWRSLFAESLETGSGTLVVSAANTLTKKTLQGTSEFTGILEDATFSGLGTSSFTVTFWFYAEDTNSDPTLSSNTKIRFLQSTTERHVIDLGVPDITVTLENTSGGTGTATFDTNLVAGNWYHVVIQMGLVSPDEPKLWLNGQEISSTGFTSPGGTVPSISRVSIYLDDGTGMQDLVFWDSLLDGDQISELYMEGYYLNPSFTSFSGGIISWFSLGEESALSGFDPGDTLSGTINLADEIGTNSFTVTAESEFSILGRQVQELANPGLDINSISIRIRHSHTPSSSSDFGQRGEIAWDSNYLYVCVDTDTWKRVSLGTW